MGDVQKEYTSNSFPSPAEAKVTLTTFLTSFRDPLLPRGEQYKYQNALQLICDRESKVRSSRGRRRRPRPRRLAVCCM